VTEPLLHYDVHGSRGPYLLMVHGMLASRAQWLDNIPALTKYCRPVVVELLGHGRSPSPEDTALYAPARYITQFETLREALGAERWLVCGASLGGALTLRYALDCPERVTAHVFTNSMSALAPEEWRKSVLPLMQAQAQRLEQDGRAVIERHPLNPARAKRIPAPVRDALAADSKLHDPLGVARTGLYTVPESSSRSRVAENVVPTLLVVGEKEERFAEQRRFAAGHLPHLQTAAFDAGHAVNAEVPAEFNRVVGEFLAPYVG
jgi:2-succinyl-6-hydroxy-2,4-cyclohexadiene-1-carboxylate synthase